MIAKMDWLGLGGRNVLEKQLIKKNKITGGSNHDQEKNYQPWTDSPH